MVKDSFVIVDKIGFHARPAAALAKVAATFSSDIKIQFNDKEQSLKSMLAIMALGVKCNDTITITCDGDDAAEALIKIKETLAENKLI